MEIVVTVADGRIEISLGTERSRTIGSFRLPVTTVNFRVCGVSAALLKTFMERFDLYFRRGGG